MGEEGRLGRGEVGRARAGEKERPAAKLEVITVCTQDGIFLKGEIKTQILY